MEILIFTSPTCAPCRQVKPELLKLQERHKFRVRVVEASPENGCVFLDKNVRAVPTVIGVTDEGVELGRFTGPTPPVLIEQYLKNWGAIPK